MKQLSFEEMKFIEGGCWCEDFTDFMNGVIVGTGVAVLKVYNSI